MPTIRSLLLLMVLIVALAIPAALLAAPRAIRGTVDTTSTTNLSASNRLVVRLLEKQSNGATIERAARERNIAGLSRPFSYNLPSVDDSIFSRAGSTFSLEAIIAQGTTVTFRGTATYTSGGTVNLTIQPGTGYLPPTGSGALWLLLGLALAALAGILAVWRWLRMRAPAQQFA